jgi:hypothetical protein
MGVLDFRDAYEFDPESYGGEGGGLPGMLRRYAQEYGIDLGPTASGAREYNPETPFSSQGDLGRRLLALHAEQSQYQPVVGNGGQPPFAPQNPNFTPVPQPVRPLDAYSPYDPETYGGEGGGLLGRLSRHPQQHGIDFGPTPSGAPEYNPDSYSSPQGGLLSRLLALHAEQSQYQPTIGNNAASAAEASAPQTQAQYEVDQAQRARETAAARLARGVRSVPRAEAPPPDPIDIAKSAGIGLVNGAVNAVGLPGDMLTGFGYFPSNFLANQSRRIAGLPQLPANEPDHFKSWTSDEIRHWLENRYGEFYKPGSRAGRFAETIGEMAPAVLGGEGVGAAIGTFRGGRAAAGAALRELPGTLAKHAVAPAIAVQTLEEALPESKAGQTVQKAYPVLRRVLPAALAAKRHLGRRVVSY